ncbi:hypothetical protein [Dehalobacter sp. TeCB1]|uniref:hypothetical protein n=1 Tax=Dehalobacter sp. TeCB1 TaxID=1843715 RepID=UPI00083B1592|nr:hypothetical protein [Dehalobacter sp. TeCB1]OCZ54254.1 hypothetical protein A7D23_05650 [Dehalobacter sp. TeCB1]
MVKWELDVSDNLNQRTEGFSTSIGMSKERFIKLAVLSQLEEMEINMDERRRNADQWEKKTLSQTYIKIGDEDVPVGPKGGYDHAKVKS